MASNDKHPAAFAEAEASSLEVDDLNLDVEKLQIKDPNLEESTAEMDSQPTAKALHNRINADISQLLQRFENIMATATVENPSHTATAVETYQIDVESTALIRAAEDILTLTRTMKEMWLFGKLDTIGEDDRDVERREKLEKDVLAVEAALKENGLSKLVPEK